MQWYNAAWGPWQQALGNYGYVAVPQSVGSGWTGGQDWYGQAPKSARSKMPGPAAKPDVSESSRSESSPPASPAEVSVPDKDEKKDRKNEKNSENKQRDRTDTDRKDKTADNDRKRSDTKERTKKDEQPDRDSRKHEDRRADDRGHKHRRVRRSRRRDSRDSHDGKPDSSRAPPEPKVPPKYVLTEAPRAAQSGGDTRGQTVKCRYCWKVVSKHGYNHHVQESARCKWYQRNPEYNPLDGSFEESREKDWQECPMCGRFLDGDYGLQQHMAQAHNWQPRRSRSPDRSSSGKGSRNMWRSGQRPLPRTQSPARSIAGSLPPAGPAQAFSQAASSSASISGLAEMFVGLGNVLKNAGQ